MKRIAFLLMIFCSFQKVQSQTASVVKGDDVNEIYNSAGVDIKPEFPGGYEKFYKYIGSTFKAPNVPGLSGKILVSFVIEKDGSVTDIRVLRDIGYGTNEEAIRVLKNSPKWIPAEQNGKKVRCSFMLPINIDTTK